MNRIAYPAVERLLRVFRDKASYTSRAFSLSPSWRCFTSETLCTASEVIKIALREDEAICMEYFIRASIYLEEDTMQRGRDMHVRPR